MLLIIGFTNEIWNLEGYFGKKWVKFFNNSEGIKGIESAKKSLVSHKSNWKSKLQGLVFKLYNNTKQPLPSRLDSRLFATVLTYLYI